MIPRRALVFALLAASFGLPAQSATYPLSPENQALLAEAGHYIEGLTTAEGRFIQTDGGGRQQSGAFWLQRPGRARFDYDPPSGLAMASDGRLVSVVDRRLKTIQNFPLGLTPLSLFLSGNIRLDRDIAVDNVAATNQALHVTLADRRGPDRGTIRLDFSRYPLALSGWSLRDARGRVVEVRLTQLERSAPKPKSFFDIYDPSLHGVGMGPDREEMGPRSPQP